MKADSKSLLSQVIVDRSEDIAIIHLGSKEEKAVVLNESRMESLTQAIDKIHGDSSARGLVIVGAHESSFCAGADINAIEELLSSEMAERLALQGQELFSRIAALKIPTIAAISGPCVGGGFEMALACDYRIALDSSKTKIGLPEIKIGIVPGFGGTQRLPRLIGLPGALDIILKGKVVSAKEALGRGMVDGLFTPESSGHAFGQLMDYACDVARGKETLKQKGLSLTDKLATYFAPVRNVAYKKAKASVEKSTKGNYPAPPRALDCVMYGLQHGLEAGLKEEARALGETLVTPECKALVHVFFLTEEATKRWRLEGDPFEDATLGVIGSGTMGLGIIATFLFAGLSVVVVEPIAAAREAAVSRLRSMLAKKRSYSEQDVEERLKAVTFTDDYSALEGASLVVEAIIEDMATKKQVLQQIEEQVGESAIIATNTSSLSISEMANALNKPGRVIGLHFFNPAERMPLVEVIRATHTDERALALTASLGVKIGKYPVVVNEVPGFLVNRTLSPFLVEGAHLLAEGYRIESIDALATDFGMPMGPLRLVDEIGLDVAAEVARILGKAYGERMTGPAFSKQLTEKKRLGKKSGKGFYIHEGKSARVDEEVYQLLDIKDPKSIPDDRKDVFTDRLILSMVAEAVRSLDENVAGVKGKESAGQVDLATVMGLGFAPFRGGVLYYAEKRGAQDLKESLDALASEFGARFKPSDGLVARANSGGGFLS